MGASGDTIDIVGEFNTEITIQQVTKAGRIFVTSNPDLNVLGIETIDQFDLRSRLQIECGAPRGSCV